MSQGISFQDVRKIIAQAQSLKREFQIAVDGLEHVIRLLDDLSIKAESTGNRQL